jgi:hypothetical protein
MNPFLRGKTGVHYTITAQLAPNNNEQLSKANIPSVHCSKEQEGTFYMLLSVFTDV